MPRVMVMSEHAGTPDVLMNEQVSSVHLDSEHSAWQFVERLGWAISDAEEREQAAGPPAGRTPIRGSTQGGGRSHRRRGASTLAVRALLSMFAVSFALSLAAAGSAIAAGTPPPPTVLQGHPGPGATGSSSAHAYGPEILDGNGNVVWFHPHRS